MDAVFDMNVTEIFRGNLDELKKDKTVIYGISVITLFELCCGNLKERGELFLEKIFKLCSDEKSAKFAGEDLKKKSKTSKVKDLFIVSDHSMTLYTCDDFEKFKD